MEKGQDIPQQFHRLIIKLEITKNSEDSHVFILCLPTFPPELKYVTLRSVVTPVLNSPREAIAKEPPRSTRKEKC